LCLPQNIKGFYLTMVLIWFMVGKMC